MNTPTLTSETMTEDAEDQFSNLIEQAITAFAPLAREADQPLWSKATGFTNNFRDLGTLPITQLKQIRTNFLVLSRTIAQFYQLLDSIVVGNFESITLNPAKTKTARDVQLLSKIAVSYTHLTLPTKRIV